MTGLLARWILSSVVRRSLAIETAAVNAYRDILAAAANTGTTGDQLRSIVSRLLEEDEGHAHMLRKLSAGDRGVAARGPTIASHVRQGEQSMRPAEGEERVRLLTALEAVLAVEESAWIYYGNLRRVSRIHEVNRAFEILAGMEKEHADVIRQILGRPAIAPEAPEKASP